MIDSLVGNDYSLCLCSGIHSQGIDVQPVVSENKIIVENEDLVIKKSRHQ